MSWTCISVKYGAQPIMLFSDLMVRCWGLWVPEMMISVTMAELDHSALTKVAAWPQAFSAAGRRTPIPVLSFQPCQPYSHVIYCRLEHREPSGKVWITCQSKATDPLVTCSSEMTELAWGKGKDEEG